MKVEIHYKGGSVYTVGGLISVPVVVGNRFAIQSFTQPKGASVQSITYVEQSDVLYLLVKDSANKSTTFIGSLIESADLVPSPKALEKFAAQRTEEDRIANARAKRKADNAARLHKKHKDAWIHKK